MFFGDQSRNIITKISHSRGSSRSICRTQQVLKKRHCLLLYLITILNPLPINGFNTINGELGPFNSNGRMIDLGVLVTIRLPFDSRLLLPENRQAARRILLKSAQYTLRDGILYRKSYLMPLIRCLDPKQSEYVLQEVHFGSCGSRVGPRMLAKKIIRLVLADYVP